MRAHFTSCIRCSICRIQPADAPSRCSPWVLRLFRVSAAVIALGLFPSAWLAWQGWPPARRRHQGASLPVRWKSHLRPFRLAAVASNAYVMTAQVITGLRLRRLCPRRPCPPVSSMAQSWDLLDSIAGSGARLAGAIPTCLRWPCSACQHEYIMREALVPSCFSYQLTTSKHHTL